MDLLQTILWPLKWAVELILVGWHWILTLLGVPESSGLIWVLSIVGLVLVVRSALIPLFVKQIKSQRKMMEIAPELKKVQEKYRGKKDQLSREAMSRETMALYKKHGTSPVSGCLPLLVQMPIFFALFNVLNGVTLAAQENKGGVGLLSPALVQDFYNAKLFGVASLHDSLQGGLGSHRRYPRRARDPHDRFAVLHSAPDHLEEPVARGQDWPGVPDAEDHALHPPPGIHLLGCVLPARCRYLLVHQQPVDDGPAVPRDPQHADAWFGRRKGARRALGT